MILDRLVAAARGLVAERRAKTPERELAKLAAEAEPPRDFAAALRRSHIGVIAEIKRASPSKGVLRANLDAAQLARCYATNGAAAISVLTEPVYFGGSTDDLTSAKRSVAIPVLRKDFIVEPYQVYEARAIGADAFLLIVAALEPAVLGDLIGLGRELGMAALVEVHDEVEVGLALSGGAKLVGINNRNLVDFTVDIATTERLRPLIPEVVPVVGESGIHSREDVERMAAAGVSAVLIGEALVTSEDPGAKLRRLLGRDRDETIRR